MDRDSDREAMKVPPSDPRLALYRRLTAVPWLKTSYARKFALAASIGALVPLIVFILYLVSLAELKAMLPVVIALVLACFAGFLGSLSLMRELLAPIDLTAEALRDYIERRRVPELPAGFADSAGRLMEGTQYTLSQLHETISRLERFSHTDDLTGIYNRRAAERRLAEEVARSERDLESFHLAFFDINKFKSINDTHGHSAGDACIAHLAALLELNTRHSDWVARWGGDEFVVGLHRNRAVKTVMERIVRALDLTPCELAPGHEIALTVSCGVAEYRFGAGTKGLLADADRAMYNAKQFSRTEPGTHVSYWNDVATAPEAAEAG